MNTLVNQLLDVSRIAAGRLPLDRKQTNLIPIIRAVAEDAQERTPVHRLVVDAPDRMIGIVDSLRLEQVITNLVDNAIKFSPDGGEIAITVAEDGARQAHISIRDHGIGIPEGERAHIFDRYYQAHSRMHRSGMGLGLFISHQIVELHKGRMGVAFPPDGGTEFSAVLPLGMEE
jgi:signal transduction histidine kinase